MRFVRCPKVTSCSAFVLFGNIASIVCQGRFSSLDRGMLRTRLVVVRRADDAKRYMDSCDSGTQQIATLTPSLRIRTNYDSSTVVCSRYRASAGMTARCVLVDISMPHAQQAAYDRTVCKMPNETFLKTLGEDVKKLTPTQVRLSSAASLHA